MEATNWDQGNFLDNYQGAKIYVERKSFIIVSYKGNGASDRQVEIPLTAAIYLACRDRKRFRIKI